MLDQDISKMKVSELREALKAKGLNTTGNKQELVDRLTTALSDGSHIDSKFEDDLLDDDDLDNDEKSLLESTKELLQSPESSKSTTPEAPAPAKKVTLKRNIISVQPFFEEKAPEAETKDGDLSEPEKKVIKISEMTAKDRLEMRAKKFGAAAAAANAPNLPSKDKLDARAARFGLAASSGASSSSSSSSTGNNDPATEELLKKRAERFGAISTVVKKSEYEDKLQKRKERFGESAAATAGGGKVPITGPESTSTATGDYAEKARLRLERFKQAA